MKIRVFESTGGVLQKSVLLESVSVDARARGEKPGHKAAVAQRLLRGLPT